MTVRIVRKKRQNFDFFLEKKSNKKCGLFLFSVALILFCRIVSVDTQSPGIGIRTRKVGSVRPY